MTPALGLLLTTCVLLAAPAKEEDPAARAQATLQHVSKLPQEHQRVWLRLIEQRFGWAALLTLKPEDAQREQARVARILRQKTVGWNELAGLLRQLDQREKAAIARMVRQYRSEVYETFRTRPRDLVDRQEAWYRIWSLWEKAGSPPEQQDRLMDWLADAIKSSNKEAIGPLPPDPKFGDGVELVPEQLVKQLTQPSASRPDAAPPSTAPRRPAEAILPSPALLAGTPLPLRVPDPRRAMGPAKQPSEAAAMRAENRESLLLLAAAPPCVVPPLHVFPPSLLEDPLELTRPPRSMRPAVCVIVQRTAPNVAESSPEAVAQAVLVDAKRQAAEGSRQPSLSPPTKVAGTPRAPSAGSRTVEPPPLEPPMAALAPAAAAPRSMSPSDSEVSEPGPPRGQGSRFGEMALLPRKLAQYTLPRPQQAVEYRVDRKSLEADAAVEPPSQPSSPAAAQDQHAQVNVEELGTRIEGINLSLRNLEAELQEKHAFTADQLDSLLSRLDILVLRQKDLALFRDLLAPREQAKLSQVDSSRSVVTTMGARIAELRSRTRENEKLLEAERTAALTHLDELSDRLATMTAER